MDAFGILNINKPGGVTSRDVVTRVERLVRPAKAGHAGTLDPLASGVLVVPVGGATRLIEYVQRMRKSYWGTFLLGRESPTEDLEGEITELTAPPIPTVDEIRMAAARLTGQIEQRPPQYSALKVRGQRAYQLARQGRKVDLTPRPVMVYDLEVERYQYPELVLRVTCGAGTYIRSLGRDLAESLGTAAVMAGLVRTAIGPFRLEDAVELETLDATNWARFLRPPTEAVAELPQIMFGKDEIRRLHAGQLVDGAELSGPPRAAAVDNRGRLVGIVVVRNGCWAPERNFPLPG